MNDINRPMFALCDRLHMLTGMALAWGDKTHAETAFTGLRREIVRENGVVKDAPLPVTESTVYDLASLTKLFTAVSVLMLMERRLLSMTDTMGRVDGRFSALNNTSVFDIMTYLACLQTPERIDRQRDARQAESMVFKTYEAKHAPGAKIYSDMNALVLKYAVETVSGQSYGDFLQKNIFDALGMNNTWARVPEDRLRDCVDYSGEHRVLGGKYIVMGNIPLGTPHDPKAAVLSRLGGPAGHAGLFSTIGDMVLFAQGLLGGKLISRETLSLIGLDRTGILRPDGAYRQFMGLLCFSKSRVPRLSEVPQWMSGSAFGLSGYTGNHIAIDPELQVFDIQLGNRCHNRVSVIEPEISGIVGGLDENMAGMIAWPDGRKVYSSYRYVYLKDRTIHEPVYRRLSQLGWLNGGRKIYG